LNRVVWKLSTGLKKKVTRMPTADIVHEKAVTGQRHLTIPRDASEFVLNSLELVESKNVLLEPMHDIEVYLKVENLSEQNPVKLDFKINPQRHVKVFYYFKEGAPIFTSDISLAPQSKIDVYTYINGANAQLTVNATVAKEAEANFTGLTEVQKAEHAVIQTNVHHTEGQNLTWQKFYSYAADTAAVAFTGRIRVDAGADGAVAHQLHRGVMLTEGARINAEPFLNIYHDDVKCTHGATVGFIDEEAKHYLLTRGISPAEADSILILSSQKQFYEALPNQKAANFFEYQNGDEI